MDPNALAAQLQDGSDPQGHGPHITRIPLETISNLAPFSGLIICITVVVFFLIRYYLLEGYALRKFHGTIYTNMSDRNRRGFVNHHISGGSKAFLLLLGCYPTMNIAFGNATYHTPMAGSKIVTQGDILLLCAEIYISTYIVELIYRAQISYVSVAHHIGTILVAQSAISISLNLVREKDASIEFLLCMFWGAFDIVSEILPHLSIILYRIWPDSHQFLAKLFKIATYVTFSSTIIETIVIMWLFGVLWNRWTIAFKVVTPLLHTLFAVAQLWGTWNFYGLWKKQERLAKADRERADLEAGGERPKHEEHEKKANVAVSESLSGSSSTGTAEEISSNGELRKSDEQTEKGSK